MERKLFSFAYRRIIVFVSVLLALFMVGGSVMPVFAEPEKKAETAEKEIGPDCEISAEAAILIDTKSGIVLYEKNPDKVVYPASTTKIMTAMIVLEAVKNGEVSLEDKYTMTKEIFETLDLDGSSIYLEIGESMSVDSLLKGLMIASGNDAAAVLANGVAGSIDAFVERMNKKAADLGLTNTHFANPHGLHDEKHYTTARELAIITKEAMKSDVFREIVEIAHIRLEATNMKEERYFINTNNLVSRMRYPHYFYEYATGVKTGTTTEAGSCLVASAEKDGRSVISVVLKSSDNSAAHNESKAILEHGLDDFSQKKLAKRDDIFGEVTVDQAAGDMDYITLSAENNFEVLFPNEGNPEDVEQQVEIPSSVTAPITSGQVIGKVSFVYKGQKLGEVNLVSTVEVERSFFGPIESFFEWIWSFFVVRIIIWVLLGAIAVFAILLTIGFVRALKKTKRKHRRSSSYRPPRY